MTDDDMLDIVRQYAQDTHWALPDGMYWDIVHFALAVVWWQMFHADENGRQ